MYLRKETTPGMLHAGLVAALLSSGAGKPLKSAPRPPKHRVIGIRTRMTTVIIRVGDNWQRHIFVERHALHATKGWRKHGKTIHEIQHNPARGIRPTKWRNETAERFDRV